MNVRLYCILFQLSHQCLTHAESNRTLIQCLICLDCHFDFIANTDQQEATFGTVDRDLANQLIETLGEELLTEWAETCLSRLAVLNLEVKLVLQVQHIDRGGWLW